MVRWIQSVVDGSKVVRLELQALLAILQVLGSPGLSLHCSTDFEKATLEIRAENEISIRFAARPHTIDEGVFQAPYTCLGKDVPGRFIYVYQSRKMKAVL